MYLETVARYLMVEKKKGGFDLCVFCAFNFETGIRTFSYSIVFGIKFNLVVVDGEYGDESMDGAPLASEL